MGTYNDVFELRELSKRKLEDVFNTFWKSGQRSTFSDKSQIFAYTVFTVNINNVGKKHYLSQNTQGEHHAEKKMVKFLKEQADGYGSLCWDQNLIVYMNFSPCHTCSGKLCSLKRDVLDELGIELELVVAHLYKTIDRRNDQGLRNLHDEGVVVRAFNSRGKQDWQRLARHVLQVGCQIEKYRNSHRKETDTALNTKLVEILDETRQWQSQLSLNIYYINNGGQVVLTMPEPENTNRGQSKPPGNAVEPENTNRGQSKPPGNAMEPENTNRGQSKPPGNAIEPENTNSGQSKPPGNAIEPDRQTTQKSTSCCNRCSIL